MDTRKKCQEAKWEDPAIIDMPVFFLPCPHPTYKSKVINRASLTRSQYIELLATPKGFKWDKNTGLATPKKVLNLAKDRYNTQTPLATTDYRYLRDFVTDLWNVMTPKYQRRMEKILMDEYGLTETQAKEFLEEQRIRNIFNQRTIQSRIYLSSRHDWIKEFAETISGKLGDYLSGMLRSRRTKRVGFVAAAILEGLGELTGEKCTLQDPQNTTQNVQVLLADRLAIWLSHVLGDYDEELCRKILKTADKAFIDKDSDDDDDDGKEKTKSKDKVTEPSGEVKSKGDKSESKVAQPSGEEKSKGEKSESKVQQPSGEVKPVGDEQKAEPKIQGLSGESKSAVDQNKTESKVPEASGEVKSAVDQSKTGSKVPEASGEVKLAGDEQKTESKVTQPGSEVKTAGDEQKTESNVPEASGEVKSAGDEQKTESKVPEASGEVKSAGDEQKTESKVTQPASEVKTAGDEQKTESNVPEASGEVKPAENEEKTESKVSEQAGEEQKSEPKPPGTAGDAKLAVGKSNVAPAPENGS